MCVQISGYICFCTYIRLNGGLAGDAERSTSLVLATALCHAAMLCHAAANAIQRPRAVQHRGFALLRANGRSPAPRKRVQAFSTARCSVSGAGCATLHRDQRLADRLRARRLVRAARCAALLRNKFSKLARLLNETIVRNLFPSLSTAARKRWCTSTTLRFLLDGSFCLISHDFNRACSCLRASLEVSSSKTRKASRTRHIGPVLRSVSGSCSTQCQRSAKVSKGAGGAGCSTLPSAESREPGCSALLVDTCAAPPGADAGCAAPLSGPHCADCDIGGCVGGSPGWRAVCHGLHRTNKGCA